MAMGNLINYKPFFHSNLGKSKLPYCNFGGQQTSCSIKFPNLQVRCRGVPLERSLVGQSPQTVLTYRCDARSDVGPLPSILACPAYLYVM